ncbi:MAG: class I SAM-dependent methyltransferase [Acidimicrobiia bacterium]
MGHSRYHVEPNLTERNSHALTVEKVGWDKRVLDVGCASGYLGAALARRGCRVVGIELDAMDAAEAKNVLDDVVIGDVEEMDLVTAFGEGSFDVVVLADILEHLKDPTRVLRQARAILRPGGFVVASIPNVAHGSVRLALLHGEFTYQPTGLLDETHLRWFTRRSVEELFRDCGFVIAELDRTVLGVFDTSIEIERADFDPQIVESIEHDDEALTFQFIVRAVADDATTWIRRIAERERAQRDRIVALEAELEEFHRLFAPEAPPRFRIGVLGSLSPGRLGSAYAPSVLSPELRRRLGGVEVRILTTESTSGPLLESGEPADPLGELDEARLRELAATFDLLVTLDETAERRLQEVAVPGRPELLAVGVESPPVEILLPRVLPRSDLLARYELLQSEGRAPRSPISCVVVANDELADTVGDVVDALSAVENDRGAIDVFCLGEASDAAVIGAFAKHRNGRVHTVGADRPVDVLAVVAAASVVIAPPGPLPAAAAAYGRPVVLAGWTTADADAFARRLGGAAVAPSVENLASELARALDGAGPRPDLRDLELRIDDRLDVLAVRARDRGQSRSTAVEHRSVAELAEYYRQLRQAYDVIANRLVDDRARLGRRIAALEGAIDQAGSNGYEQGHRAEAARHTTTRAVLDQANHELARLQVELVRRRPEAPAPAEGEPDTITSRVRSRVNVGRARSAVGRVRRRVGRLVRHPS